MKVWPRHPERDVPAGGPTISWQFGATLFFPFPPMEVVK